MQLSKLESTLLDVIVVYRSERGNSLELLENIKSLITHGKDTAIFGDFNICYLSTRNNRISKYLEQNGFSQLVREATHIQGRLLDHFYLKTANEVKSSVLRYSPYYSDHDAICTSITFPQK